MKDLLIAVLTGGGAALLLLVIYLSGYYQGSRDMCEKVIPYEKWKRLKQLGAVE